MDPVDRISAAVRLATTRAARAPAGGEGFRLPGQSATSGAGAAGAVGLVGLLAVQEAEADAARDRAARRRGRDLLAALAALQRSLLSSPVDAAALERLAALASGIPRAGDPELDATVQAIALRARVELARYGAG